MGSRRGLLEDGDGSSQAASTGGGKGDDGFSSEVTAFEECLDNTGRFIPPDGEAKEKRIMPE